MAEINDLNITDASNTARFPEAMAPSAVNDGARALEGLVARWHENINTSIATTGSSNAYVLAAKGTQVLFDGLVIGFDANHANTGAATLNVDSTGVKNILKHNDVALASGDIEANQKVIVIYDGTSWQMVSPLGNAPAGILSLAEDTTPQLGGFLDANSKFISHAQGANIASVAGDTDIWANFDGNTVHITGTNAITDFGTPKSAGDSMWVIFDGAASVVDSATITVAGNTNYQAAANDLALVYALTTSTFLFMPFPNSGGSPVASSGGAATLLATVTASNAASADFTSSIDGTYDVYKIVASQIIPASNGADLWCRIGDSGGFDSGASDYFWVSAGGNSDAVGGFDVGNDSSDGDTKIALLGDIALGFGSASGEVAGLVLYLFDPSDTSNYTVVGGNAHYSSHSANSMAVINFSGARVAAGAMDRIQFLMSSGNINGVFRLYGLHNS